MSTLFLSFILSFALSHERERNFVGKALTCFFFSHKLEFYAQSILNFLTSTLFFVRKSLESKSVTKQELHRNTKQGHVYVKPISVVMAKSFSCKQRLGDRL